MTIYYIYVVLHKICSMLWTLDYDNVTWKDCEILRLWLYGFHRIYNFWNFWEKDLNPNPDIRYNSAWNTIAMIMQPHDGWLMRGAIEVCIPPAVTSLRSARFFAFALSFHELQLFLIDLFLWSTRIHCCLRIVTSKHGLKITISLLGPYFAS